MDHYWQEISALTMRWVRRLSREKFSMLFTLVQPMLFWLIFFGNLFQRAADTQVMQAPNYISFLAAGVVVMTTNYLDEADQLCDRLAIIDGGTIKTMGSPVELKIALGGDIVSLTLKELDRIPALETELKGQPAITSVRATTKGLDIRVESPEKALPTILESANRLNCRVEFIQYNRPRLDDVFIAHTGRAITESIPEAESA